MHKGEIRESGSHQELLQLGGMYKKLYDLQLAERGRLVQHEDRRLVGERPRKREELALARGERAAALRHPGAIMISSAGRS